MRIKTEVKRQAIVEVAAQTFAELGFERTSMDEIAARVGGSKATLYGYFSSKSDLFVEVTRAAAMQQLAPAFSELEGEGPPADLPASLCRFGEKLMSFVCETSSIQVMRMVIGEAGSGTVGRDFYEEGPAKGGAALADFLARAMKAGQLRVADASVAAQHLMALLQSELIWRLLYGVQPRATRPQIKQVVDRAAAAFLIAYAPLR